MMIQRRSFCGAVAAFTGGTAAASLGPTLPESTQPKGLVVQVGMIFAPFIDVFVNGVEQELVFLAQEGKNGMVVYWPRDTEGHLMHNNWFGTKAAVLHGNVEFRLQPRTPQNVRDALEEARRTWV